MEVLHIEITSFSLRCRSRIMRCHRSEKVCDETLYLFRKALRIVKAAFKQRGPIDGSWIYTEPEPYQVNGETIQVYKTGVTRSAFGELEQYEVMVNAKQARLSMSLILSPHNSDKQK